ncbi:LamG-like jellyroll fold domain-containing protein [Allokutzneria albata]|uniref:LamG-like jellyroll fold domain-containing protein n=1 Tax=Allokutzneria albata TaxID=211114 RepID=UPI00138E3759|nr:LamG-like jellyroll fold domain-containing protein [Allokutzneria albata]
MSPVRVRVNGSWRPIDLTLTKRSDGSVGPVAAGLDLRLSGGGTGPLVVLGHDTRTVGLDWSAALPAPVLSGPTATYRDVLPGVDLAVRAEVEGFRQMLVVKTAEAARDPRLEKITFGSRAAGVRVGVAPEKGKGRTTGPGGVVRQSDGLAVTDDAGNLVFRGDASRMWDSAGGAEHPDRTRGPLTGDRDAPMGVEVAARSIAVKPDLGLLRDQATRFPVFIDPEYHWAGRKNHHAVVQSAWPDAHNYDVTDGLLGDLKAGYANENGRWMTSRSFVELDLAPMRGKIIHGATLRSKVVHSYSCSGGPTQLWVTGPIDWGTTWNAQPNWARHLGDIGRSNNAGHCPSDGGADIVITSTVADGVAAGWNNITFGLRAAGEGDKNAWRRFDLNPVLEITYNTRPNPPSELGMEAGLIPCATGAQRPFVFTKTPRLRARLSDEDGGMLDAGFRLLKGPWGQHTWDGTEHHTGNVPSGSFAEVTVRPGLIQEDGVYSWHLWSGDYEASSWSPVCEFTVDSTPPSTPVVSSTDYPSDQPSGGLGRLGTFELSAGGTPDVQYYKYSFTQDGTDVPKTRVEADGLGGKAVIKWTPRMDGPQILRVKGYDRAHNESATYSYRVIVKPGNGVADGLAAHWPLDGDGIDESGKNRPLTAVAGPAFGPGHRGQAALLDGTSHFAQGSGVVGTASSFSVATWARLDRDNGWFTALSRDGSQASGFYLQYSQAENRWTMSMFDGDTAGPAPARAMSKNPPQLGVWTHLVGTYDAATGRVGLFVNGVLEGEATIRSWPAAGDFVVGAAKWQGKRVDHFPGALDDVRVYDRVLVPAEAAVLANQPVVRAHYALNEGSGKSTVDSVSGAVATVNGTVSWAAGEYTALRFTGAEGSDVTAPKPAIRTDRSFTVAAWVRPEGVTSGERTAVAIGGRYSPFRLSYRAESKRWEFLVNCAQDRECPSTAASLGEAKPATWTHLTAVYDAAARQIRLYVDGQFATKADNVESVESSGDLVLGRGTRDGRPDSFWMGLVDDVKVLSGVPSLEEIGQLKLRS